jgi:MiaB/RimO family radical SAM methylthiotransferase
MGDATNFFKSRLGLATRQEIVPYYNLRIAEGCSFACSYCAIKFATGSLKSKPIDLVIEEFKAGLDEGHKVFQLISEDTGCYGLDIGTTFPILLSRLLEIKGDYEILIIDFCGHWLVKYYDELLPLFIGHQSRIRELYVSLQSGSDKILRAMRRPEKSAEVIARLQELEKKAPHINLRTTVIIGFPGETDQDFEQTIEAVRGVGFSEIQLNKYEDRPGTVSSMMQDKIPQEVIDKRYEKIKQYC